MFKYIRDGKFAEDTMKGTEGYERIQRMLRVVQEFDDTAWKSKFYFKGWKVDTVVRKFGSKYLAEVLYVTKEIA